MKLDVLLAPATTAVVIVEAQRGVVGDESVLAELASAFRDGGALDKCARLVAAARVAGVPVIHAVAEELPGRFGHSRSARLFAGARKAGADHAPGSASSEPMPELWADGDLIIPRHAGLSSLTEGTLDTVLRNEGIRSLVLAGVSLNVAITNMVFDAVNRAYQVVLPVDAVAAVPPSYGEDVIRYTLSLLATCVGVDDIVTSWTWGAQG